LSGPFAQLLRYTAPVDARSTTVRLRSARTASLAFETKFRAQNGLAQDRVIIGGKRSKSIRKKSWVLGS